MPLELSFVFFDPVIRWFSRHKQPLRLAVLMFAVAYDYALPQEVV